MAVWNQKRGGYKIKINDTDHLPPHCHVNIGGRNAEIDLITFEILNPPPHEVPAKLRKYLKKDQEQMLKAWDSVKIVPFGGNPEWE